MIAILLCATRYNDDPMVMAISIVVFLVVIIIVMIVSAIENSHRRCEQKAQAASFKTEYMRWRQRLDDTGELESGDAGLELPDGEECFFAAHAVLKEPRAVHVSDYSGYGVSPLRGVRVFEGGSTSRSHDEWRPVSSGVVYITNKRVIFAGDMHNRTVKLGDVLAVDTFIDAVGIRSAKRQKTMRFCGINGQIAADTIELLRHVAE